MSEQTDLIHSEEGVPVRTINVVEESLFRSLGSGLRPDVFPGSRESKLSVVSKRGETEDSESALMFVGKYGAYNPKGEWDSKYKGAPVVAFYYGNDGSVSRIYFSNNQNANMAIQELSPINPELTEMVESVKRQKGDLITDERGMYRLPQGIALRVIPFTTRMAETAHYDSRKERAALVELKNSGLLALPISKKEIYRGNPADSATVIQGEVAYITKGRGLHVGNTFGLADCIGLVVGDRQAGIYALAHIDGSVDINSSIPQVVGELRNLGAEQFEARLFGGTEQSAGIIEEISHFLQDLHVPIVEADVLHSTTGTSIGVSVDGVLYGNTFSDDNPSLQERMQQASNRGTMRAPLKTFYHPNYNIVENQPGDGSKEVGDWQNILYNTSISEDLRGLKRLLGASPGPIVNVWLACDEDKLGQFVDYANDQLGIDRQAVVEIDLRQTPVGFSIDQQLIDMAEQIRNLPGDKVVVLARGFEAWIAASENQSDWRLAKAGHDYDQIILHDNPEVQKIYREIYSEIGKKVIVITQIGKSLGGKPYKDALDSARGSQFATTIIQIDP